MEHTVSHRACFMKAPYSANKPYESTLPYAAVVMKVTALNVIMKVTAIFWLHVQSPEV